MNLYKALITFENNLWAKCEVYCISPSIEEAKHSIAEHINSHCGWPPESFIKHVQHVASTSEQTIEDDYKYVLPTLIVNS